MGTTCSSGLSEFTPAHHTFHLRLPVEPRWVRAPASAAHVGEDEPVGVLTNGVLLFNHTPGPAEPDVRRELASASVLRGR